MNEGPAGGGRPDAAAACPVGTAAQTWIESSMRWFAGEFGADLLRRDVISQAADFISADYSATPDEVDALVRHLCTLMMVDPARVRLDIFDGSAERAEAKRLLKSRKVGHFHMEGSQAVIGLDSTETSDPVVLTAIAVHELCHVKLLGERRIDPRRADNERLTDLLTVFFGFGIFSANIALRFDRARRGWSIVPQGDFDDLTLNAARRNDTFHRIGYLKPPEFGYALASFCWLRRETDPAWAGMLDPGPRGYLRQGLAFLAGADAGGGLPTQQFVNKSARIGGVTISVTPARATGPGHLGVIRPQPSGNPGRPKPADRQRKRGRPR